MGAGGRVRGAWAGVWEERTVYKAPGVELGLQLFPSHRLLASRLGGGSDMAVVPGCQW